MADTNERKHDRIVIAETLEAIVALQFDTNARYLRTLADAAAELRKADAELTATPPADAALADSIDSLGFVISGDNPPVKEWVSECGGGCMPATKEEKMMWDVLQSALRARAVPDDVAKDAARYRWLRDGNVTGKLSVGEMTEISDEGWERVTWLYDEELDAEIDAAMLADIKEGRK